MQQKILVCLAVLAGGYLIVSSMLPEIPGIERGHVILIIALISGGVVLSQTDSI